MSKLILVRHGISEYNAKGLWTGWDNPPLAKEGIADAKKAAEVLKDFPIDIGFTSIQKRHKDTLDIIKDYLGKTNLPIIENKSLNERNYGIYTRRNKWEVRKEVGDETFFNIRRGWDHPIPEGESLKQTYERVVAYYKKEILPMLSSGKNIIISSSGNALRSLVKFIENISDEDITKLEIAPGEVYVYQLDEQGKIMNKQILNLHPNVVQLLIWKFSFDGFLHKFLLIRGKQQFQYLEKLSDNAVENLEIEIGAVYFYTLDKQGTVLSKKIL